MAIHTPSYAKEAPPRPEYSVFGLNYRYALDKEVGEPRADSLDAMYAGTWSGGYTLLLVETGPLLTRSETAPTGTLALLNPSLSSGQIFNWTPRSFLKDISLGARLTSGIAPTALAGGPEFRFQLPGFRNFIQLGTYARNMLDIEGVTYQLALVTSGRLELGPTGWKYFMLADYIGPEGPVPWYLLARPRLLFDVAHLWGASDRLYIGAEYRIWLNATGVEGLTELTLEPMVSVTF